MKHILFFIICLNSIAEVSSSLQAGIVAAKELNPQYFAKARRNIKAIRDVCEKIEVKKELLRKNFSSGVHTKKEIDQAKNRLIQMQRGIENALSNQLQMLDVAVDTGKTCSKNVLLFAPVSSLKVEAKDYLKSVLSSVQKQDYQACTVQLTDLLAVEDI